MLAWTGDWSGHTLHFTLMFSLPKAGQEICCPVIQTKAIGSALFVLIDRQTSPGKMVLQNKKKTLEKGYFEIKTVGIK